MAVKFFKTIRSDRQSLLDPEVPKNSDALISPSSRRVSLFEENNTLSYKQMEQMYERNIWVRACVDRIKNTAASVDPVVRYILPDDKTKPSDEQKKHADEIKKLLQRPNTMKMSFENIIKSVLWDKNIYDAASIEWVRDKIKNNIVEMYPVSGDTIRLNLNANGVFKNFDKAYFQVDNSNKIVATFKSNEICYIVSNPRSGTPYGISPLETLARTVTAELSASDFNYRRFKNDATPKFAVLINGAGLKQGGPIIKRFQKYWERELKGNPHKPIFLTTDAGEIKLQKTGLTNQEMEYQEYSLWLMSKIATIYEVPPFVLGVIDSSTGKLNSEQQYKAFKRNAVYPPLNTIAWHANTEVIWADDSYNYDDIYLDWNSIDISDKESLSKIHKGYLQTGVYTINDVLDELGRSRVPWGDKPFVQKQYVPIDMLGQDMGNSFNGTPVNPNTKMITGLEKIEPSKINEAITSLLNKREKALNTFFMIPKDVNIKNVAEEE